jgi:hypothetical protein
MWLSVTGFIDILCGSSLTVTMEYNITVQEEYSVVYMYTCTHIEGGKKPQLVW